jgi:hypothetical protein
MGTLLLETVLIVVESLTEDDGKTPVTYSRELGQELLLDPDYRAFRARGAYAGAVVADRHAADQEIEAKTNRRPDLAGATRSTASSPRPRPLAFPWRACRAIANRLELPSHRSFEALAFRELSTDRPAAFDRGAFPGARSTPMPRATGWSVTTSTASFASSGRWMRPISIISGTGRLLNMPSLDGFAMSPSAARPTASTRRRRRCKS